MVEEKRTQPVVLSIDTDSEYNKKLQKILSELGVKLVYTTNIHSFLVAFKKIRPDLCIAELDLENKYVTGIELVKSMRSRLGGKFPIIILSRRSYRHEIDTVIDAGADDYVIKPLDSIIFEAKLRAFIKLQTDTRPLPLFKIPEVATACSFQLGIELVKISENGFVWKSQNTFSVKGFFSVQNDFIQEVTGRSKPLLLKIDECEVHQDLIFGSYNTIKTSFEEYDTELRANVRRWLEMNT